MSMDQKSIKSITVNKKAYHDYFVEDRWEAGIELFGTEVKSIRQGSVNLRDSYCIIKNGEILLCGHTHIPKCIRHDGFVYMNPGSVSIPKEGSAHSFMTFENGVFRWINLETNEVYQEYRV